MTPPERLFLKRLLSKIRAMNKSEAQCYCGRHYRLTFDNALSDDLDIAEALIDQQRVSYLEVD